MLFIMEWEDALFLKKYLKTKFKIDKNISILLKNIKLNIYNSTEKIEIYKKETIVSLLKNNFNM